MALADKNLNFNGTSTYVDLGPVSSFGLDGDFTIEMHFACFDVARPLLGIGIAGTTEELSSGKSLCLSMDNIGRLRADIPGAPALALPGVTSTVGGICWYHVALRYTKSTREWALFLNGELEAIATATFTPDPSSRVALGRSNLNPGYFHGYITEVRFFSVARTKPQIKADVFRRMTGLEQDLTRYFPLDGIAPDSTTAARDAKVLIDPITRANTNQTQESGTITGGTWATQMITLHRPSTSGGTPAEVVVGEFDGATSHITVPDSSSLSPTPLTVEAYVRPTGTGRPYYTFPVVSKHGAGQGWELRAGNGRGGFLIAIDGVYHDVNVPLENDVWHFLVGMYDGKSLNVYVNGVRRGSKAVSGTISAYPGDMNIGRNPYWTAHRFAGQIGEIRIFNEARSAYNSHPFLFATWRYNVSAAALRAKYRMEGDATDCAVASNGAHSGTATNVRWVASDPPLPASSTTATAQSAPDTYFDVAQQNIALAALRASLESQLESEKRAHADTTSQTVTLGKQLDDLTSKRDALTSRIAYLDTLVDEIAAEDAALASLAGEIQALKSPRGQISLADFVKKAHAEVQNAREALAASGGGYSFARMNLEIKMLPAPDGANLMFPDLADVQALGADKLSTLNIGFESADTLIATPTQVEVPSVIGTTEALARRVLAARDLGMETSYQAILPSGNATTDADRVVTQLPAPGTFAPAGSKVTIFLGREA